MTPEAAQPFELLFWVMVLGPGLLLASVAALFRRSWILWGLVGILATLLTLLMAEKAGSPYWNALIDRGYTSSFVAAIRAISAAGAVTFVLLALMAMTRRPPAHDPLVRQEPVSPLAVPSVASRVEIPRVPPDVFAALLATEQLDAVLEADAEGDRIRVQRRGGGVLGYMPRLQAVEVAQLARKGGRLRMWVADRQSGGPGDPGLVQVAYEESSRGAPIAVEVPGQQPAVVTEAVQPAAVPAAAAGGRSTVVPLPRNGGPIGVPASRADIASQLATLASLKSSGALSEAEFEMAKRKVLQS